QLIISFLTLTVLEIVLGVDNLIFIAVATDKLPKEKQKNARRIGLLLAMLTRLLFLYSAVWLAGLTDPLFTIFEKTFSSSAL
uniref:TerC family protein n=1 Tax=Salmonella enterica TaxID=28901 RepID=UPI003D76982A